MKSISGVNSITGMDQHGRVLEEEKRDGKIALIGIEVHWDGGESEITGACSVNVGAGKE